MRGVIDQALNYIATHLPGMKAKTDRLTLSTGLLMAVNTNGNPYIRWVADNGIQYQLVISSAGIRYEQYNGSTWTTIWQNH